MGQARHYFVQYWFSAFSTFGFVLQILKIGFIFLPLFDLSAGLEVSADFDLAFFKNGREMVIGLHVTSVASDEYSPNHASVLLPLTLLGYSS